MHHFKTATQWIVKTFLLLCLISKADAADRKTQNVFLIITDGFRWQEVFDGAEARLMTKENGGVADTNALRAEFWRETTEARREALLPFFWNKIAKQGQLFGNQSKGSIVTVANGKKFSYPGYSEMITGVVDPRINSNGKIPNPNTTVFEWLNEQARLRGRVAVLGNWDVFPYIFNIERSHLQVWPHWEPKFEKYGIVPPAYVTALIRDTISLWGEMTFDSFLIHTTEDYLKHKRPRLAFIGFSETDEWAHEGRYDLYLAAAHNVDRYIARLWDAAQAIPQYRGKTTFIITADHGRGSGLSDWKSHGETIVGAEGDWLAVIGPDTPPLGERTQTEPHTHTQIAATIAALLGYDYYAAFPQSGKPIADVIGINPPKK